MGVTDRYHSSEVDTEKVWREVNAATSQLAPQDRARIFGGPAIEVYRLAL
jgi:hypothetical protein